MSLDHLCDYCARHPRTSFDYVRHYYGVPAARGMRVTAYGKPGVITSGRGGHIRIRLDGETHTGIYHPTSGIIYHTPDADVSWASVDPSVHPGVSPARMEGLPFVPMHAIVHRHEWEKQHAAG